MDRKTALSTAAALTMTCSAAVAALFTTIGCTSAQPGSDSPEVITEYHVVAADALDVDATTGTTIREIEYVQASPVVTEYALDDDRDDHHVDDDHDDDHHEDDDDD